jgi:hypothetical protein
MEEEGDHILGKIFMERFGSGTGRSQSSPAATICGEIEREKRGRKKREKEERARSNRYRRQGGSLVGALLCPKGASEIGALSVYVA